MKVVDFYTDKDKKVWKQITKIAGLEQSYLDRRVLSGIDINSLSDSAFADPENRLFPVFSKEAAYVSYLYAKIQKLDKIASLIENILSDIYDVSVPKEITINDIDIFDLKKEASNYKDKDFYNGDRYKSYKQKVASKIKDMDLDKIASIDAKLFKTHMDLRKTLCDRMGVPKDLSEGYIKVANYFFKNKPIDKVETFLKIADVIETIDKKTGVDKRYEKDIPNPFYVVSHSLVVSKNTFLNGVKYPIEKLLTIPLQVYRSILGENFVQSITKDGKIDPDKLKKEIMSLSKVDVDKLNKGLKVLLK